MRWTTTAFDSASFFVGAPSAAYSQAMDGNLAGTVTHQIGVLPTVKTRATAIFVLACLFRSSRVGTAHRQYPLHAGIRKRGRQ